VSENAYNDYMKDFGDKTSYSVDFQTAWQKNNPEKVKQIGKAWIQDQYDEAKALHPGYGSGQLWILAKRNAASKWKDEDWYKALPDTEKKTLSDLWGGIPTGN
jgi:hypothetical protein